MQIVHFGHSCLLLDTGTARLLIDPGSEPFASGFENVTDLDAILITHQHGDHLDKDKLPALVKANPGAQLVVDEGTASIVTELGLEAIVARPGDSLRLAGATVEVFGGDHATIYGQYPGISNACYLIDDGAFVHPGDSLVVPDRKVDVLGLPTAAPWLKMSEAVDYLRAVAPRVVVPIHQGVLSEAGLTVTYRWFDNLKPAGTELAVLPHAEPVVV